MRASEISTIFSRAVKKLQLGNRNGNQRQPVGFSYTNVTRVEMATLDIILVRVVVEDAPTRSKRWGVYGIKQRWNAICNCVEGRLYSGRCRYVHFGELGLRGIFLCAMPVAIKQISNDR